MSFQYASWPLPNGVYAGWSTRKSGYSTGIYASNNVALHVSDNDSVELNRRLLRQRLQGQPLIHWLNQTHSTDVVDVSEIDSQQGQDGVFTQLRGQACNVMTADCLPVFLWSAGGEQIAAVHAGWRGLANGILATAVKRFAAFPTLYAGIGPAISQTHFEVGDDVKTAFHSWPNAKNHFLQGKQPGKYQCNLPAIAADQLQRFGVQNVYFSGLCSYADSELFYSYRRDGLTGRMANLIWKT